MPIERHMTLQTARKKESYTYYIPLFSISKLTRPQGLQALTEMPAAVVVAASLSARRSVPSDAAQPHPVVVVVKFVSRLTCDP